MSSIAEQTIGRLASDQQLSELLTGGVWSEFPTKGNAEQRRLAWDRSGKLLPCAVVRVSGHYESNDAPGIGYFRDLSVYLYQARPERDIVERALGRVIRLLHDRLDGVPFATDYEGAAVSLHYAGSLGDNQGEPALDATMDQARFTAAVVIL